jgi:hypothetical protein
MANLNYVVLICKAPSSSPEIFSLLEIEPSDEQLKEIWKNQNLQTYRSEKYGQYSDLIEVCEFEQLEDAFLEIPVTLKPGDVLMRNPRSSQDSINAYFP